MLKQQDMTETARVVFNELSVTEPATVGEIAQNTYLSRERCQLILTQLVMAIWSQIFLWGRGRQ
ncbi:TrmB family transcriptional regulator [Escherichia coli]|uniref:TrmB family transcriptional regulator n=1 Tax=Escherichia coli TaxID=562 RepID=UPI003CE7157C